LLNRSRTLAILAVATLTMAACEEKLNGGNACPSLCTEQQLGFTDTTFLASDVIDTMITLPGIPSIGTERTILIARYAQNGDSVVSVGVFRFDSIVHKYQPVDTTAPLVPFTSADSVSLTLELLNGLDTIQVQDTVTFTAYNVAANVPYLDTGVVHSKFSGTPIGTLTLPRDSVQGFIRIPLDTLWLTQAMLAATPVNIGISVSSKKKVNMQFVSAEGSATQGRAGVLTYTGSADTAHRGVIVLLNARANNFGPAILAMQDYQMSFKGTAPYPPGVLAVGGLPSNRVLIRFKFPSWLIDSSTTIVRADLIMYQQPFSGFRVDSDSVVMNALPVTAAPNVTDLSKVGVLVGDPTLVNMVPASLPPFGTGIDTLSLIRKGPLITPAFSTIFLYWHFQEDKVQRAIIFALAKEGLEPRELWFYGTNAPVAQRPRVHVSYVPHAVIGLP
jgi:hypothetical protein